MGFLRWFKKEDAPVERFDGQRVFRLRADEALVLEAAAPEGVLAALCPRCGEAMEEALLVSRLPDERVEVAVPSRAVDGWACFECRAVSGPRFLTPKRSVEWGQQGADHVRARNFGAAEWWFTRLASSWPDYPAAWMDLATAFRAWSDASTSEVEKRALTSRRRAAVRRAAKELERDRSRTPPHIGASIFFQYAQSAAEAGEWSETRRIAALLMQLDGPPDFIARREELTKWLATEPDVSGPAMAIIAPHMPLADRRGALVGDAQRASVAGAAATLEAHYERHPNWKTLWMAAKGWQALGEWERSLAAWRKAERLHGDMLDVVSESSLACLLAGLHEEARDINRRATARMPTESSVWSNLAMCEVLCGDVTRASAAVAHALKLEDHPRTRALATAIERWAKAGTLPRTFEELNAMA